MTNLNKIERDAELLARIIGLILPEPDENVQKVIQEIANVLYQKTHPSLVLEFAQLVREDPVMINAAGWTLRSRAKQGDKACSWLYDCIDEFWTADKELTRSRIEAGDSWNMSQAKLNYMEERKLMARRWMDRARVEQGRPATTDEEWKKAYED